MKRNRAKPDTQRRIDGRTPFRYPALAPNASGLHPRLVFLQHPDDLFFREPAALHRLSSLLRRTRSKTGGRLRSQVTSRPPINSSHAESFDCRQIWYPGATRRALFPHAIFYLFNVIKQLLQITFGIAEKRLTDPNVLDLFVSDRRDAFSIEMTDLRARITEKDR